MKLGSIPDPFAGEKLADIYPRLAPFVEQTPRLGRLNYFPGRHLTDVALGREQAVRVDRLALRGQAVAPGVVEGLEVSWRAASGGVQFQLQPGHALTAAGEDMVVDRIVDFAYEDLRLYDPVLQRVSELPLGLSDDAPAAAFAAVLLLQPGRIEDADLPLAVRPEPGATDFTPCPRVPEDEIYYRTTSTDAARLILYPLPWDEPPGALWRNRAAWSVFNREAAGEPIPWQDVGVPLAMIGFNDSLFPDWVDRHAVARPAGKPRPRVLIQRSFDARVWWARFEQFCAELSSLPAPVGAAQQFQFLPPIGMLPKAYLELLKRAAAGGNPAAWEPTQHFFPRGYTVDVSVVPREQLDALLFDTVRLQPYDLSHLDSVRLLLPVSQQWFDPDLLKIEAIDPKFDQHIARYRQIRGEWLARRYDLANRRRALEVSAGATPTPVPLAAGDPDPKRLETPETPIAAPPGDALQFGVTRTGSATAPAYASQVLAALRADGNKFLRKFTKEDQDEFKELLTAAGVTAAQITTAFQPGSPPAWLAGFNATATDTTLTGAERDELRRELLAYIRRQSEIHAAEQQKVNSATLPELIDYFETNANQADELVEAGFLKVRTDVFRLGTLLSNNSLATKFAASPSLANVVERKPAKADTAAVNTFASQLLANFAPSAVGSGASTAAAGSTAGISFRALTRDTAGVGSVGALTPFTLKSTELISAIGDAGKQITESSNLLDAAADKLSGEERTAFEQLRQTAAGLTSAQTIAGLQGIAEVERFADTYVPNFNLLSQKQLRAIPLERLRPALAPTVRQEIHDGRLEIFERLTRLDISLGDLTTDFVDAPGTPVRPAAPIAITRLRFQTLISRRHLDTLATIRQTSSTTTEIVDADESRHFSSGVSYADMAMAALRAVETRLKEYRAFIGRCRAALRETQGLIQQIATALIPVEVELDEARQDVAVALALKAEEQARLDAINRRREQVLAEHVEFLVYHRPRAVALNAPVPSRRLEPALQTEPVVECLQENPTPPADLAALRESFLASPVKWWRHAPEWLQKVDRWEHLRTLLEHAGRAAPVLPAAAPAITAGRFTNILRTIHDSRLATARKFLAAAPAIMPAALTALSWVDLRRQAERQLTLGQLIGAGSPSLAKAASAELEDVFAVATCLHENFSAVPGLIRLEWAERFGQFDQVAVDFRDLSRLPGWPRIEFTLRREMQLHADWLFRRVVADDPAAIDLINDLIRVALLLASHAPVDQLIVGHPVENEVTPRPGGLLALRVDPLRVRLGMEVVYKVSDRQVMRAVVEDISASQVSARVLEAPLVNGIAVKLTPSTPLYFKSAAR